MTEDTTGHSEDIAVEDDADETGDEGGGTALRRGDLVKALAAGSQLPRTTLREVIDGVLAEIGKALDEDRALVLPPLGKLTVKRRKEAAGGDILSVRIKRQADKTGE